MDVQPWVAGNKNTLAFGPPSSIATARAKPPAGLKLANAVRATTSQDCGQLAMVS